MNFTGNSDYFLSPFTLGAVVFTSLGLVLCVFTGTFALMQINKRRIREEPDIESRDYQLSSLVVEVFQYFR
jgi:hypothetical protein